MLVYGKEITSLLPKYNDNEMIRNRLDRLQNSVEQNEGNLKVLHITAGEVIHLMAYYAGVKSRRKKDVLNYLLKIEDREALEIFSAYLDNLGLVFSEGYLVDFIKSRIEIIKLRFS